MFSFIKKIVAVVMVSLFTAMATQLRQAHSIGEETGGFLRGMTSESCPLTLTNEK